MPEKNTLRRANRARRQGKSSSTQAGEFVREEMHHVRSGKHGAKNTKQAIAIGLSKARRSGVNVPKRGRSSSSSNSSRSRGSSSGGKTWRSGGGGNSRSRSRGRGRSQRGGSSRSRSSSSRSGGRSRGRSGGSRSGGSSRGGSRSGGRSSMRRATWSSSPRVMERQDALVGGPLGGVVI